MGYSWASAFFVSAIVITNGFLLSMGAQGGSDDPSVAAFFAKNVKVNSGGTGLAWQVEPSLVIGDNGVFHVGWKEASSAAGGGIRVGYSYSADSGNTWSPNILMATTNPGTRASDPWLIKDSQGRIHFTRLEFTSDYSISGITTSNTTDGVLWGNANYLDDVPNFADKETVTVDDNGVLYMAFNSDVLGVGNDMVFTKSFDGGATWTPKVRVPDTFWDMIGAYITLDSTGRIFVAWTNFVTGNIMLDYSMNGGASWGTDIRVNDVPGSILDPLGAPWNLSLPAMVVDSSDKLYVSWTDYRSPYGDIYVARSRNRGITWDPAVRVNDDTGPSGQRMADLTVDRNDVLHAAWYDLRGGNYDVYYSNSSDGGQTWSPNLRVTTATTSRIYQRPGDYITIRTSPIDDNPCVVWTDGRGIDFDIYFSCMHDTSASTIITTDPPGLQIQIDGVTYTAPQVRSWGIGETHQIGTFANQTIGVGSRYAFTGWSDGGNIVHQIMVLGQSTFTAYFGIQYLLTVTSAHGNTSGGGWLDAWGTGVTCVDAILVQQSSDTRHRFTGWGGDATGSAQCSDPIMMSSPREAVAYWITQFLVAATSLHGNVTGHGWFDSGNSTALVLDIGLVQVGAGERARFNGWTGDAAGQSLTSDPIVVDSPKVAMASWQTEYLLTVNSPHGNPTGGGWYVSGTSASISVETYVSIGARTRLAFSGWTGAISSLNPNSTVVMNAPATVSALWRTEHFIEVLSERGVVNGTGWYAEGFSAGIAAPLTVEEEGMTWGFNGWDGDFNSTEAIADVMVDSPKVIRANWILIQLGGPQGGGLEVLGVPYWIIIALVFVILTLVLLVMLRKRKKKRDRVELASSDAGHE